MNLSTLWTIIWLLNVAGVALAIENILRTRREPRGMLAWILALILIPFLGLILYGLIGPVPMQRKVKRRAKRRSMIASSLAEKRAVLAKNYDARALSSFDASTRNLMRLATTVSGATVTTGNAVDIYNDAERAFLNLGLAIEAAEKHVHMEYYIFIHDETGQAMRDLLVKKVKQGVEVRLLIDAVGSWRLSRKFVRQMRKDGIEAEFFLPWGLTSRRFQLNCRNHRKMTVIDGRMVFTGSKNIADEYLGRKKKFGPWRDTYMELEGPCVTQFQELFAEDWHFATGRDISSPKYFPPPERKGEKIVQVVPSGPDGRSDVMHQLLNAAVWDAETSISIVTPYFIPDRAMLLALTSAAYRGLKVKVLVPSKSDNWLVLWAGRTFYEDLIEAGVEVYEYDAGMVHSKVVTVDQRWAMVGSANMDIRSFQLNFELTSILYDAESAQYLHLDCDTLCETARRIDRKALDSWPYHHNLTAGLARLAVPIL